MPGTLKSKIIYFFDTKSDMQQKDKPTTLKHCHYSKNQLENPEMQ